MAGFPSEAKGNKLAEKAKRPHPGIPLDQKVMAELIVSHRGNVTSVARAMGSCRGSISQVIDRNPELQKLLKQSRERWLDEIEESVFTRAAESNDTALQCFVLKTQGRARGWEQEDNKHAARDVASAAFDFILSKQPKSIG